MQRKLKIQNLLEKNMINHKMHLMILDHRVNVSKNKLILQLFLNFL